MYAGPIRNALVPTSRRTVFSNFDGLSISKCPFRNLPGSGKGRWGEGLTAEDIQRCPRLKPQLVAAIEFLEWTLYNTFVTQNSFRSATIESLRKLPAHGKSRLMGGRRKKALRASPLLLRCQTPRIHRALRFSHAVLANTSSALASCLTSRGRGPRNHRRVNSSLGPIQSA